MTNPTSVQVASAASSRADHEEAPGPRPPDRSHYESSYLGAAFERLASYRRQLRYACADGAPQSVLLVGKGDGLVGRILEAMGSKVATLDVAEQLAPDIVGSVDAIPLDPDSYDVTLCCQVLEHIPFDRVATAAAELCRVTRRRVVISVPDVRRYVSARVQLFRHKFSVAQSLPRLRTRAIPRKRLDEHGHHWELGFKGYPIERVRAAIRAPGWRLTDVRREPDLQWHCFFVLEPEASSHVD